MSSLADAPFHTPAPVLHQELLRPKQLAGQMLMQWSVVATAVVLLLLPFGTFADFPPAVVVWGTAGVLFWLAFQSFMASRWPDDNPWLAPAFLLMAFYFFKYGWGTLVIYYWDVFPWKAFPGIGQTFHRWGIYENLPNTCHLLILGGLGLYLGVRVRGFSLTALLPTLRWPISEEKFRSNLVLYTPVALLIFTVLRWYLPVSIQFLVLLFGMVNWVLIVIASYWLFSSTSSRDRLKWSVFLAAVYVTSLSLGVATGMGGHFLYPGLMVLAGYALARRRLPWTFLLVMLPVAFLVILPWLSIYKFMDDPAQSVYDRLSLANSAVGGLTYGARLEVALDRFLARMTGSAMPAVFAQYYPDTYPFEMGRTFLTELSGLVPRPIWLEKPNISLELNRYTVGVGLLPVPDETSSVFDAVSEYYLNFGTYGVFLLSVVHGLYLKSLHDWLMRRCHFVIGASIYIVIFATNLDFFGVVQTFISHTRQLPVWLFLLYLMSKR